MSLEKKYTLTCPCCSSKDTSHTDWFGENFVSVNIVNISEIPWFNFSISVNFPKAPEINDFINSSVLCIRDALDGLYKEDRISLKQTRKKAKKINKKGPEVG